MERYPSPNMNRYAGVLDRRVEALLIDGFVVGIATAVLGFVLGYVLVGGQFGGMAGAYLSISFGMPLTLLVYHVGFEGYYGQTPGKYARGIVVVKSDGSQISWAASLIRNLLRFVDALPAFYLIGIVAAYASDEHQRVGDMAGDTVVVYTRDGGEDYGAAATWGETQQATK